MKKLLAGLILGIAFASFAFGQTNVQRRNVVVASQTSTVMSGSPKQVTFNLNNSNNIVIRSILITYIVDATVGSRYPIVVIHSVNTSTPIVRTTPNVTLTASTSQFIVCGAGLPNQVIGGSVNHCAIPAELIVPPNAIIQLLDNNNVAAAGDTAVFTVIYEQ